MSATVDSPGDRFDVKPDPWLAGVFGCDVFRVAIAAAPEGDASRPDGLLAAARGGRAFFYAKVPTARVDVVKRLTAVGFSVVDVGVTFERAPGGALLPQAGAGPGVIIRDAAPADRDALLDCAGSCFVYSRFHLDPLVPRALADAIKREWVRSYLEGRRGDRLLTAERDGRAVGFLAQLSADAGVRPARVIDLVGVDRAHQGLGVGRALVDWFTRDSLGKCAVVRVGTQVANIPSIRIYESCGYRLVESAYVLHAHVSEGRVR
jgi:GNAT superfamily N-acetyltransferase